MDGSLRKVWPSIGIRICIQGKERPPTRRPALPAKQAAQAPQETPAAATQSVLQALIG